VTVMFDEQVRMIGGGLLWRTTILKLQLVIWPQELLAVQVTVLVPRPKQLPLGGVQNKLGGGLHPPLALAL